MIYELLRNEGMNEDDDFSLSNPVFEGEEKKKRIKVIVSDGDDWNFIKNLNN